MLINHLHLRGFLLNQEGLNGRFGARTKNAVIADAVGAGLLDVSSGVEESPGIKSHAKLAAFFASLRGTGRDRP